MHDARCNRQCPGKPTGRTKAQERELLRACHPSGQMSAEQSVQHYREGILQEAEAEDQASNKALLWGLAACAALVCLCVIFQPFFK